MSSFADLRQHLINSQSSDQSTRRYAEQMLYEFLNNPGSEDVFIAFVSDTTQYDHFRQLCMVLLGQHANRKWKHLPADNRVRLITFTLQSSQSTSGPLQKSSVVLLGKIYANAVREEREQIMSLLLSSLTSPDISIVTLALRCLYEIAEEVEYDSHLEILRRTADTIIHAIEIVGRDQVALLRYAARVVRLCACRICNARITCGLEDVDTSILNVFVLRWVKVCLTWMRGCNGTQEILYSIPVILEFTKSLTPIMEAFPEFCNEMFSDAVTCACVVLASLKDQYRNNRLADMDGSGNGCGYTSDGDRMDIETVAIHLLDLLCVGLTEVDDANSTLEDNFDQIISALIEYMHLTEDLQDQFIHDGNEFIASEQEDTTDVSLRQSGVELFHQIIRNPKQRNTFGRLFSMVQRELQAVNDAGSTGTPAGDMVYRTEAVLWTLGAIGNSYMKYIRTLKFSTNDTKSSSGTKVSSRLKRAREVVVDSPPDQVVALVGSIIQSVLQPNAPPLLQGRGISVFSVYSELFGVEHVSSILEVCSDRLGNDNYPVAARLQACRAISQITRKKIVFTKEKGSDLKAPFVYKAITGSLALQSLTAESTAHFPIETVVVMLSHYPEIISGHQDLSVLIAQVGFDVWKRYPADALIITCVNDMFSALIRNTDASAKRSLAQCFIPIAHDLLLTRDTSAIPSALLDAVIEMLSKLGSSIMRHCQVEDDLMIEWSVLQLLVRALSALPMHLRRECVQALVRIFSQLTDSVRTALFTSDRPGSELCNAVASVVVELLKASVQSVDQTQKASEITYSSGMHPGTEECAGNAAGLICIMLIQMGDFATAELVDNVISVMLDSMMRSESQFLRYSLIVSLVHLFARNAERVAPIIAKAPVPEGQSAGSALLFLMQEWQTIHRTLNSKYHMKISAVGLTRLVQLFSAHECNHYFASQALTCLLDSLPELLSKGGETWEGDGEDMDDDHSGSGGADGGYDDYDFEDEDDDFAYEGSLEAGGSWDGDNDGGDDDGDDCMGGLSETTGSQPNFRMNSTSATIHSDQNSPFAPAEMYLLDAFGSVGGAVVNGIAKKFLEENLDGDGEPLYVNVSDDLVFSPHKRDPLGRVDVESAVSQCLHSICTQNSGRLPNWMGNLSGDQVRLVNALVALEKPVEYGV